MPISIITLKCANCGANLEISPEMEQFACGYCGASQVVERSGGTVRLKLLTDAISKVQAGTDKTAAELAIRRLREDLANIENDYQNLEIARQVEANNLKQNLKTIWGVATVISLLIFFKGGWVLIIAFVVWASISGTLLYFFNKQNNLNEDEFSRKRQNLFNRGNEIEKMIETQYKIVDS